MKTLTAQGNFKHLQYCLRCQLPTAISLHHQAPLKDSSHPGKASSPQGHLNEIHQHEIRPRAEFLNVCRCDFMISWAFLDSLCTWTSNGWVLRTEIQPAMHNILRKSMYERGEYTLSLSSCYDFWMTNITGYQICVGKLWHPPALPLFAHSRNPRLELLLVLGLFFMW